MNALHLTQIAVILCCLATILLCLVVHRVCKTVIGMQRAELRRLSAQTESHIGTLYGAGNADLKGLDLVEDS